MTEANSLPEIPNNGQEPVAEELPPKAPGGAFIKGFAGGIAGALVVSAAVGGLAVSRWPAISEILLADFEHRLDQAEHAVNDINPRLAAAERELAQNANADTTGITQTLAQRVQALETQGHGPAAVDGRVGALVERVERLTADVARLNDETQNLRGAIPPEGTILRLAERAEAAEKQVRNLATQHASAEALLLVVGQLNQAVASGEPFPAELQAARRLSGSEQEAAALDQLAPLAEKGVPRRALLLETFPATADAVLNVSTDDSGLWQGLRRKAAALITLRRTDGAGNGAAATVARAEKAVQAGDLARAAEELQGLDERSKTAATAWIAGVNARIDADRAVSALAASAMSRTAQPN